MLARADNSKGPWAHGRAAEAQSSHWCLLTVCVGLLTLGLGNFGLWAWETFYLGLALSTLALGILTLGLGASDFCFGDF